MAQGRADIGVVTDAVDRHFDIAKFDFELATFAAGQDCCAKMITDLEPQTRLVIYHQR